ncbi:MAG: hypothetical protein M1327_04965 [Candidatus Thermoplasmatota archaeon]|nr:hypothetical protein [Candidatus Thermoplasmatota archaeon]
MEAVHVFPDSSHVVMQSDVKRKKMQYAIHYISMLGTSGLSFAGISGSVSYEPDEQDDVDIFLIADDGRLWEIIFRAFIRRRLLGMDDICVSLCMSASYALNYYSRILDPLIADDAVHVIPVYGKPYYEELLSMIGRNNIHATHSKSRRWNLRSWFSGILFVMLAPMLIIKGLIVNHHLASTGRESESFKTLVSSNYFVLDSAKYRTLMERRRAGSENID